jgi:hypothetical protein
MTWRCYLLSKHSAVIGLFEENLSQIDCHRGMHPDKSEIQRLWTGIGLGIVWRLGKGSRIRLSRCWVEEDVTVPICGVRKPVDEAFPSCDYAEGGQRNSSRRWDSVIVQGGVTPWLDLSICAEWADENWGQIER